MSSGCTIERIVRLVEARKFGRRVAGDALDLVADRLQHEVVVPGRAVDRARHVLHQRAQQAVVGALLGGAQAGARAGDQLRARERAVQVVVGAGVEHRVGHPALRGDRDRQQPGVAQARVVAQQAADRGRVEAGGVTVDDDQVDLFGLELGDRPRRHAEPPAGHAPRRGARTGSPAPRRPPRAPRPDAGEQLLHVPLTATLIAAQDRRCEPRGSAAEVGGVGRAAAARRGAVGDADADQAELAGEDVRRGGRRCSSSRGPSSAGVASEPEP